MKDVSMRALQRESNSPKREHSHGNDEKASVDSVVCGRQLGNECTEDDARDKPSEVGGIISAAGDHAKGDVIDHEKENAAEMRLDHRPRHGKLAEVVAGEQRASQSEDRA